MRAHFILVLSPFSYMGFKVLVQYYHDINTAILNTGYEILALGDTLSIVQIVAYNIMSLS